MIGTSRRQLAANLRSQQFVENITRGELKENFIFLDTDGERSNRVVITRQALTVFQ